MVTTEIPSSLASRAAEIIDIEIDALQGLKKNLNGGFKQAIELIESASGRAIVTGMGKSGLIGKKIAATLSSTGTPALFLHPAEGSHGDLGAIMKGDVVIAISNSGETPEILGILPLVKRFGLPLIGMTGNIKSTLANRSDAVLDISVPQEACPLGLAPTASTTATLVMGDTLAIILLERKGFTQDDFALFHPAGTLGKRLLLKVDDVMRVGDRIPKVSEDVMFVDALSEITSKQLGFTLVVDGEGRTLGIVTDGDVRRALIQYGDVRQLPLRQVMTAKPKTIDQNALAVSALRIMEDHKITALAVQDEADRVKGVVHMHDILNTGIS